MHPTYNVDKTYLAELNTKINDEQLNHLRKGVQLIDGKTAPCKAFKVGKELVEITIHEGRNKQVKRMFRKLGFKVRSLHRIRYGPISLGKLKYGQWRNLKPFEIEALKITVGLTEHEPKETDHYDRRSGGIRKEHNR
jgi:23S rRNA pseudouridine2605 synthase